MNYISWTEIKAFIDQRGLSAQFIETNSVYKIWALDGGLVLETTIKKAETPGSDQADFETNYKSLGNKKIEKLAAVQGIPRVSVSPPEGSSATIITHDWTDPCTWYNKSSRVTGETLTLDTGNTYNFANTNVIDLTHGRLSDENTFPGYELKVYDNGVLKTEGTDYTMNYESGAVTFNSAPTTPVTADYSYANGSEWVIKPKAGKVLHIEHAELNFSKDIVMSPVAFEIWVYNPYDLPNKVKYQEIVYKNIKDIINSANLGQGFIPAIGGLTQDVLVFPFNYATVKSLKDSDGAELRVKILSDQPYSGEFSTATFYVLSEDL